MISSGMPRSAACRAPSPAGIGASAETNDAPGPSSTEARGTASIRISSRRIGTVICTSSVTTYLTTRTRRSGTRSVRTCSRSSLRVMAPSVLSAAACRGA